MLKLEELEVHQLAIECAKEVRTIVSRWENFAKFHFGGQWVEAADSIGLNFSEGYGRYFYKENKQLCFYARGSLLESKTVNTKTFKRNLINNSEFDSLINKLEIILLKLNGYIKSIGKSRSKTIDK